MEPWSWTPHGRFDEHVFTSDALRDNPLGDSHERPLWVYLPPGYDETDAPVPSVYVIQGLTGFVTSWRNLTPFRKNFLQLADEVYAGDDAPPPCVVVFVDAWTRLGGSQFVDSPGTGRYHTYLCDEIVPWVDANYRTLPAPEHRGIMGKSSGGYGAMITPLLRPDLFGGLATHAGDALFELCYAADFRRSVRTLRDSYGGSIERFWEEFYARPEIKDADFTLINDYCMAACYSANEDGTVELPYDAETGELRPDVWERWLAWDPVRMVRERADAARSWRAVYIDAGRSDEFFLDLGAEAFRRELEALDVGADIFFELFDGKHGNIQYRYPIALRYLAEKLTPA